MLSFTFNLHRHPQGSWGAGRHYSVSVLPPAINPFSPRIILRICLPGQERDYFCGGRLVPFTDCCWWISATEKSPSISTWWDVMWLVTWLFLLLYENTAYWNDVYWKCRTNQTDNLCLWCNESTFHWLWTFYFQICTRANLLRGSPDSLSIGRMIIGSWGQLWGYEEGPWEMDYWMSDYESSWETGVVLLWGMKMGKGWGTRLLPPNHKKRITARNLPEDHKRSIWGLASFHNMRWRWQSAS